MDIVRKNSNQMAAAVRELANAISHTSSSSGGDHLEAKVIKLEECIQESNHRANE